LVRQLASPRYQRLLKAWRGFLARPVPIRTPLANATRPIAEIAQRRIRKIYARVLRQGLAIDTSTPDAAVHDLRIDCKKLRYLLELFASLFDRELLGPCLKALKGLQESLGNFNDFSIQQEALKDSGRQMQEGGSCTAETLMAMGRLAAHLEMGQQRERQAVQERFALFARSDNQVTFRRLLRP
jgi:CHAD domain-containing protein